MKLTVWNLIVVASLSLGMATVAQAQNPNFPPSFGAAKLEAGFYPDPRSMSLTAGGAIATQLGGVATHISDPPSFRLTYVAGGRPLTIYTRSSGDTTLLIRLPNGRWIADDDSGNRLSPQIRLLNPPSGDYLIWVGTSKKEPTLASLWFSEHIPPKEKLARVPNPNLNPSHGSVTLFAGFPNDPYMKAVMAGGKLPTNLGGVFTHISVAPDFRLDYKAGGFPLTIYAKSKGDTTLLIRTPNGDWVADDDIGMRRIPRVRFANPQSGRYDIWVGTYNPGNVPAILHFTEYK